MLRHYYTPLSWLLVISFASFAELDGLSEDDDSSIDKFIHFFLYGVFVHLLAISFYKQSNFKKLHNFHKEYAFVIALGIGLIFEVVQPHVNNDRSFDWYDLLANLIGAILGLSYFQLLFGKITTKKI